MLTLASVGHAQVGTAVTSSGLNTTVTQNGATRDITGGTRRGQNLFHSFGSFSVGAGDTARFLNTTPALPTTNILGRVTGGERSNIFGTIDSSTYAGANLFLINPAGWLFGPSASLNVAGSFHVSSADSIRFPDVGGQTVFFHADPSKPSALSTASPIAFGFLGPTVAPISIEGSTLQVPEGATLSIIGGDVSIGPSGETRAFLEAPGGRLQIASVASAGEATLGPAGELTVTSFPLLGTVNISGADLSAGGTRGGVVSIVGGRLVLDNATALADAFGPDSGLQPGVRLQATDDIVLDNGAVAGTATFGDGSAGNVEVSARDVIVRGGSVIRSQTFGLGQAGDISVTASNAVEITGRDVFFNPSAIASEVFSPGQGGRILVSAPTVTLGDAGAIRTLAFDGVGGEVVVEAGQLSLSGDAEILSGTASLGRGGNLTLIADSITLSGSPATRITASASTPFEEPPDVVLVGDISLRAATITLDGGAQIQSGSLTRDAGNVTLEATDFIVISAGSRLSSQAFARKAGTVRVSTPLLTVDDAVIDTGTAGIGGAGDVVLEAGRLNLANGGKVVSSSQSFSEGVGGNVTITATDSLSISGASRTGLATTDFITDLRSGLFAEAQPDSTGGAGSIVVNAPRLTLGDQATISVRTAGTETAVGGRVGLNVREIDLSGGASVNSGTTGAARGGNIDLTADRVALAGQGTGLFSNAEGAGAGGAIAVAGRDVAVQSGATLSATSSGTGNAGNITLVVGDSLQLEGSTITTAAAQADGGNISITTTGSLLRLIDSRITTSVQSGVGQGGNITIGSQGHPVEFVVLNGSQISADAFGGPGGNINLFADVFLTSDSVVSASSALSTPGTIDIQARITNVSGSLAQLPEAVLQAAALLRASCAARLSAGKSSSLVVAGREGLPLEPGGVMPSPLLAEDPAGARASQGEGPEWEPVSSIWRAALRSKCSM
jgi:filamentous hemagglutinin family protein